MTTVLCKSVTVLACDHCVVCPDGATLSTEQCEDLMGWLQVTLGNKVSKTKVRDSTGHLTHRVTGDG